MFSSFKQHDRIDNTAGMLYKIYPDEAKYEEIWLKARMFIRIATKPKFKN